MIAKSIASPCPDSHLELTDLKKLHLISPKVVALSRTSPMIHLTHLSIINPLEVNTLYDLLESRRLLPNLISLTLLVTLIISKSARFYYPRRIPSRPLSPPKVNFSHSTNVTVHSILPHLTTLVIGIHGLGGSFAPPPITLTDPSDSAAFDILTGLMSIIKHCTALLHLTLVSPSSIPRITDTTSNFLVLPPTLRSYTHLPNGYSMQGSKVYLWRDNAGQQLERLLRKDPSIFLNLEKLCFHENWREMVEEVLGKEKVGSVRLVGNSQATNGYLEYYISLTPL